MKTVASKYARAFAIGATFVAIIATGVLIRFDLIDNSYAQNAISFLFGAGAASGLTLSRG